MNELITGPIFHHHAEEYCRRCDDFREGTVTGWSSGVEFECANCGTVELVEDYSDFIDDQMEYEMGSSSWDDTPWVVGGS